MESRSESRGAGGGDDERPPPPQLASMADISSKESDLRTEGAVVRGSDMFPMIPFDQVGGCAWLFFSDSRLARRFILGTCGGLSTKHNEPGISHQPTSLVRRSASDPCSSSTTTSDRA